MKKKASTHQPRVQGSPIFVTAVSAVFLFLLAVTGGLVYSFLSPRLASAQTFPRLANYYLEPDISAQDQQNLARYDIVILDMEAQHNYPQLFAQLRKQNPNIKIFAYIPAQHLPQTFGGHESQYTLRGYLKINADASWYLKDKQGNRISIWPNTEYMNITTGWSDFLARFAQEKVMSTGLWDGVFFDGIEDRVSWINNGNSDLGLGHPVEPAVADWLWKQSTTKFLQKARQQLGDKTLILANAQPVYAPYLNGLLFENFGNWPGYKWPEQFALYQSALAQTKAPHIVIINANTSDTGNQTDYDRVRWMLATASLGDGYFSFDFGPTKHGQTWWYDEYSAGLGRSAGPAKFLSGGNLVRLDTFTKGMDRHYLYRDSDQSPFVASRAKIAGLEGFSIKADATATKWNEFLRSDPKLMPLKAHRGYKITFKYKILKPTAGYFYFGSRSQSGGDASARELASWNGKAGEIGTITGYVTTETDDDYLFYGVKNAGSIAIDNIEVTELANGVWRRDFDNGAVIVNSSFDPNNVKLECGFYHLTGSQDTVFNNGQTTSSVYLQPDQGAVLLKAPKYLCPAK